MLFTPPHEPGCRWGKRTDSHHGGGDTCSKQTCTCTIILRFGVCASDKIIYHKRRKEASPPATVVGRRGGGVSWANPLRHRRLPTPRPSPCNFGSGNTRARGWQSFKLRSSVCRRNVLRIVGSSGGRAIFHYHAIPSPPHHITNRATTVFPPRSMETQQIASDFPIPAMRRTKKRKKKLEYTRDFTPGVSRSTYRHSTFPPDTPRSCVKCVTYLFIFFPHTVLNDSRSLPPAARSADRPGH